MISMASIIRAKLEKPCENSSKEFHKEKLRSIQKQPCKWNKAVPHLHGPSVEPSKIGTKVAIASSRHNPKRSTENNSVAFPSTRAHQCVGLFFENACKKTESQYTQSQFFNQPTENGLTTWHEHMYPNPDDIVRFF